MASTNPVPIRFNGDDLEVLTELHERTGQTTPAILRMAIRLYRDHLRATTPRRSKKGAK